MKHMRGGRFVLKFDEALNARKPRLAARLSNRTKMADPGRVGQLFLVARRLSTAFTMLFPARLNTRRA
jgi:hypothetical protein